MNFESILLNRLWNIDHQRNWTKLNIPTEHVIVQWALAASQFSLLLQHICVTRKCTVAIPIPQTDGRGFQAIEYSGWHRRCVDHSRRQPTHSKSWEKNKCKRFKLFFANQIWMHLTPKSASKFSDCLYDFEHIYYFHITLSEDICHRRFRPQLQHRWSAKLVAIVRWSASNLFKIKLNQNRISWRRMNSCLRKYWWWCRSFFSSNFCNFGGPFHFFHAFSFHCHRHHWHSRVRFRLEINGNDFGSEIPMHQKKKTNALPMWCTW